MYTQDYKAYDRMARNDLTTSNQGNIDILQQILVKIGTKNSNDPTIDLEELIEKIKIKDSNDFDELFDDHKIKDIDVLFQRDNDESRNSKRKNTNKDDNSNGDYDSRTVLSNSIKSKKKVELNNEEQINIDFSKNTISKPKLSALNSQNRIGDEAKEVFLSNFMGLDNNSQSKDVNETGESHNQNTTQGQSNQHSSVKSLSQKEDSRSESIMIQPFSSTKSEIEEDLNKELNKSTLLKDDSGDKEDFIKEKKSVYLNQKSNNIIKRNSILRVDKNSKNKSKIRIISSKKLQSERQSIKLINNLRRNTNLKEILLSLRSKSTSSRREKHFKFKRFKSDTRSVERRRPLRKESTLNISFPTSQSDINTTYSIKETNRQTVNNNPSVFLKTQTKAKKFIQSFEQAADTQVGVQSNINNTQERVRKHPKALIRIQSSLQREINCIYSYYPKKSKSKFSIRKKDSNKKIKEVVIVQLIRIKSCQEVNITQIGKLSILRVIKQVKVIKVKKPIKTILPEIQI